MNSFFKRIVIALPFTAALATNVYAAGPNFLWGAGTSNNGELTSNVTLMTTELNSLAAGSVIVSSGLYTNANTGQAIWGQVQFTAGTAGAACVSGASLAGWFLTTIDGTTFEPTAAVPARPPDFLIPLPPTTLNATYMSPLVRIPPLKFKALVQNNCTASGGGGSLAVSANTLTLATFSIVY